MVEHQLFLPQWRVQTQVIPGPPQGLHADWASVGTLVDVADEPTAVGVRAIMYLIARVSL